MSYGKKSIFSPSTLYDVHTRSSLIVLRTSDFIIFNSVTPFIWIEYFNATKSNHPHLLSRPVVAPYSWPISLIFSPVESNNSVGKGPDPTLVVYALKIPLIFLILFGGTPKPEHAPAEVVLDDVTYGYVPKSISSREPCAPSAKIFLPS